MTRLAVDSLPTAGAAPRQRVAGEGRRLLVVYKASCPTCAVVVPLLESLLRRSEGRLDIVAISQDDERETDEYIRTHNLAMPVLIDHPAYRLSASLGPTTVPMTVVLDGDRIVSVVEAYERESMRQAIASFVDGVELTWDATTVVDDPSLPVFKPG